MISNYLKIAWRNLIRAKEYTFINGVGLAVGMAASVLIFLWVQSELTYDRFYPKTDRLFQVYNQDVFSGEPTVWGSTPIPLAPELKANYPDIENTARYISPTLLLSANEKHLNIHGAFADSTFFHLFDFPFLSGSADYSLSQNNGIVITRSLAMKLYGTTDAIGKTIQVEHRDNFSISGILEDLPNNTQFADAEYFLPWSYFQALGWGSDEWTSNNYVTYVLLREDAQVDRVNAKIRYVTAAHLKGVLDDVSQRAIFLHPASKWHLYSKIENGKLVEGRIATVRLFGIIAAFILLIACVNFVNLSTARSEKRAKEVGIRKVAGAQKFSLVIQFISESVLLTFISGLLAGLLVWASLPAFNNLTAKQLTLDIGSGYFWVVAVGFVLFTGLLAGSYPAFFLSSFQPVKVMKGAYREARSVFSPRKGLVVLQFTFAIVLIISTLIIRQQVRYAQSRERGYDQSNLIYTTLGGDLEKHYGTLRQELLSNGAVVSMTKSLGPITGLNTRQWGVAWPGSTKKDKDIEFDLFGTDADFLKTTGARLLAGRDIDVGKYPSDSTAILLNETAVKTMRMEVPIGTTVHFQDQDWHVVGVVQDFIFDSPYQAIKPVIIEGPSGSLPHQWVTLRLDSRNATTENLAAVEQIFKKRNPGSPFEYTFVDDSYNAKFAEEQRIGSLTGLFTGLTIFIACLGLFGLAAHTAQQRTKEIGIRKVLGATVGSVVQLLTKEFMALMFIAFAVATPIGWYAMEEWLTDYEYRVSIGGGVFLLTLLVATLIVVLTVSFQAVKAALMNPVKSLRSE
ncbi:ABC transporter permease [Salmonirosea aquatica]|uniref:FtsX-like permease family protein n=1 Tax=Salmonirosea aquatica TaxID=2654236 RepID=A0A7C9BDH2_9BACT|nr:FtsX-like permease family protein [Cytophagaceae bacterium SJW1-29]